MKILKIYNDVNSKLKGLKKRSIKPVLRRVENKKPLETIQLLATEEKMETVGKEKGTTEKATASNDARETKQKEAGFAAIKPQFVNHDQTCKRTVSKYLPQHLLEQIAGKPGGKDDHTEQGDEQKETSEKRDSGGEPPMKKARMRGRFKNKKRSRPQHISADKLCPAIIREQTCAFGDKCRFSHDVEKFLADNPQRTDKECHVFKTLGKCTAGVACMFARSHISEDRKNIVNTELVEKLALLPKSTTNTLPHAVARRLRRREYDVSLSEAVVKLVRNGDTPDPVKFIAKRPSWAKTESCPQNGSDVKESTSADANTDTSGAQESSRVTSCDDNSDGSACDQGHSSVCGANNESLSDKTSDMCDKPDSAAQAEVSSVEEGGSEKMKLPTDTSIKLLDGEGIKLRPQEKKKVDFRDKLYLAPLTTVGNLPYRRVCKEYGADITCSEMATATGLLQGSASEWALMKRHHTEDVFGAQICGAYPDTMTRCSQVIMENTDVDFIDINMGCPIDLFFKKGEGCALMGKGAKLESILSGMNAVMDVPLTVKIRTGIFEDKPIAHKLVQRLKDTNISLVTMHGRSREQRYTRLADWTYIDQCCKMADPLPVIGCGDILSYDDYRRRREETNVAGCMIARGALIKPWVFTEIKERRDWDISSTERLDMLRRFTNHGLEHWGSDAQGVAITRKFLLEWLSFLHRYIPVGVLEQPPQRINEKPPHYIGRNDLETLMASRHCDDWVKISEMLLGPVPDGFEFVPKHKANAYS